MDCTRCNAKSCRSLQSCKLEKFDNNVVLDKYHNVDVQPVVQSAAALVDGGRAGSLSRIDELIEFALSMNYKKVGLAYCYGMEVKAMQIVNYMRKNGVAIVPISCTTGAMSQVSVNQKSAIHKVSCNPLAQASQMNAEGVDLAVTMGLCLGHDILFNREIACDVTTLVVKDRVYNHAPLQAIDSFPN